jgi:hypothetical protein
MGKGMINIEDVTRRKCKTHTKMIDEVVSIEHEDSNGRIEHDGTGFLALIDDTTILVTCRHVIFNQPEKRHYFRYHGDRHEINVSSDDFLELPESTMAQETEGVREENDMIFYRTAIDCEAQLLGSTVDLGDEAELHLVTHSREGIQQTLLGKRRDGNEFAETRLKTGKSLRLSNMICVDFPEAEEGHSGGAIFEPLSRRIVGMLRGRARYFNHPFDSLHMLKAQAIREKYDSIRTR